MTALGGSGPLAAGAVGLAAGGYAALVYAAWMRYGRPAPARAEEHDALLDRFMPEYDVAERHNVRVQAPAGLVLDAAKATRLQASPLARAIFRARELVLGAHEAGPSQAGLLEETLSLGWGVLAEDPGKEVVVGAVTQPWLPNVVFRALPPEQFRAFADPGFVKIAWTLRADAAGPHETIFRTETRVVATDDGAWRRFRWYWARFSPGIVLIRLAILRALKHDAEQRAKAMRRATALPPAPS